MAESTVDVNVASVNIVARKRINKDKTRIDLGNILMINKTRITIPTINKSKAMIARAAGAFAQLLQYKPTDPYQYPYPYHPGVAKPIRQKNVDPAVIIAAIISNIVSVNCMTSARLLYLLMSRFNLYN